MNELLGVQRRTIATQSKSDTCEQHYSKYDSSHLDEYGMTRWQVRLECEPKHTEGKSKQGKGKQQLGDSVGKGKCQKWCCNK